MRDRDDRHSATQNSPNPFLCLYFIFVGHPSIADTAIADLTKSEASKERAVGDEQQAGDEQQGGQAMEPSTDQPIVMDERGTGNSNTEILKQAEAMEEIGRWPTEDPRERGWDADQKKPAATNPAAAVKKTSAAKEVRTAHQRVEAPPRKDLKDPRPPVGHLGKKNALTPGCGTCDPDHDRCKYGVLKIDGAVDDLAG